MSDFGGRSYGRGGGRVSGQFYNDGGRGGGRGGDGWGRGGGRTGGRDYEDPSSGQGPRPQICRFFLAGNCHRGDSCTYLHEASQASRGGYQGSGSRGNQGGRYDGGAGYQGGGRGGFYDSGQNNNWRGGGQGGSSRGGGGRYQGNWGRGGGRDEQNRRRRDDTPPVAADVIAAAELPAHTKKVAAISSDPAAKVLYTGSHDGTVKCWSTETGQCTSSVDMGGLVDSLLFSGGFLFVGVQHLSGGVVSGVISVWCMANGQNHLLPGHVGQILCLHTAGGMLFSGGQDRSIRVWSFNAQSNQFTPQVVISHEQGGHAAPVHCFQSFGSFLASADRTGIIKIWELTTGKLAQTLEAHADAITQMLVWENFLLSASLDSHVKIWEVQEQPAPDNVIKPEPTFDFTKAAEEGAQQRSRRDQDPDKIVTMMGTLDGSGVPILIVCYRNESHLRLYELPTFTPRGVLTPAPDTRSLSMVLSADFSKGHMMVAGDAEGKLRFFQWQQAMLT